MSGFDLNAFLTTLIATLAGAAVASIISVALYRHERLERKRATTDDAVAYLVREIHSYIDSMRLWRWDLESYLSRMKGNPHSTEIPPPEPEQSGMQYAAEALLLASNKSDWWVAETTRRLLESFSELKFGELEEPQLMFLRKLLAAWRSGHRPVNEVLGRLNMLSLNLRSLREGHPDRVQPLGDPFTDHDAPRDLRSRKR